VVGGGLWFRGGVLWNGVRISEFNAISSSRSFQVARASMELPVMEGATGVCD
jgi:hypothetical protein